MIDWVRSNNLSFAIRCGGHSYEGFSQSQDVVIDLRGLQDINVDTAAGTVTVGAGVSLYDVYQELANEGYAFPAGSCPTVGIAGHVMGGGHGLLARSHGLTCDILQQVTMIDCQGSTLQATATSEPDLFWACRGGGGGSFGIATQFVLSIFALTNVLVFGVSWKLSPITRRRHFQRLADLGAERSQLDHVYHETWSCRKWLDFDAVHRTINRLRGRAAQRTAFACHFGDTIFAA